MLIIQSVYSMASHVCFTTAMSLPQKIQTCPKHPLAPNRILEISLKSPSRCNMKLQKRSTNMVASDHFFAIATPISSPMPIHCLTVTSKLFTHVWHIINSLQQSDNMMYHLFCWILKHSSNYSKVWFDGSTHQTTMYGVHSNRSSKRLVAPSPKPHSPVLLRIWKNAGKNHGARHTMTLLRMIAVMLGLNGKFTDATWSQGKGLLQNKEWEWQYDTMLLLLLSRPFNSRKLQIKYLNMN